MGWNKVTKYLKVTGTEPQIYSLVKMAKYRGFEADIVKPYPSCGGPSTTIKQDRKIQAKIVKDAMNPDTFAEGCGCEICIANYICQRMAEAYKSK